MTHQILDNVKAHLTRRKDELMQIYDLVGSDRLDGKIEALEELENFIIGEEIFYSKYL